MNFAGRVGRRTNIREVLNRNGIDQVKTRNNREGVMNATGRKERKIETVTNPREQVKKEQKKGGSQ